MYLERQENDHVLHLLNESILPDGLLYHHVVRVHFPVVELRDLQSFCHRRMAADAPHSRPRRTRLVAPSVCSHQEKQVPVRVSQRHHSRRVCYRVLRHVNTGDEQRFGPPSRPHRLIPRVHPVLRSQNGHRLPLHLDRLRLHRLRHHPHIHRDTPQSNLHPEHHPPRRHTLLLRHPLRKRGLDGARNQRPPWTQAHKRPTQHVHDVHYDHPSHPLRAQSGGRQLDGRNLRDGLAERHLLARADAPPPQSCHPDLCMSRVVVVLRLRLR